MKEIYFS